MSDNGYGWKKRQVTTLTCPSGAKCVVRRAGPEVGLRGAQMVRIFQKLDMDGEPEAKTFQEQMARLERLTDEEFARFMVFAKDLVVATVVMPKIVLNPSPGNENEIGPDDIDTADFWFLFGEASKGMTSIPVKTVGGETTVEAVETFSESEGSELDAGSDGRENPSFPLINDRNSRSGDSDGV